MTKKSERVKYLLNNPSLPICMSCGCVYRRYFKSNMKISETFILEKTFFQICFKIPVLSRNKRNVPETFIDAYFPRDFTCQLMLLTEQIKKQKYVYVYICIFHCFPALHNN